YAVRALAPVAAASLAATLTLRALINPDPLFFVDRFVDFSEWVYLLFALLGIVAAGFSVLAMSAVTWVERGLRRLPLPVWLLPTALALNVPQVLGSGYGAIQQVFDKNMAFGTLLLLLFAKLLGSAISLGSGFRGGMFSASLLLGCLLGAAFSNGLTVLMPHLQ